MAVSRLHSDCARQQDLGLAGPSPRLVEQGDCDSTENRSDQASHLWMDFIKAKKRRENVFEYRPGTFRLTSPELAK